MTDTITQCPECSTRFKVTPEQLSASEGLVRCGKCHAVFDAAAHFDNPEPSPQLTLPINEDTAVPPASPIPEATSEVPLATSNSEEPFAEPLALNLDLLDEDTLQIDTHITPASRSRGWLWLMGSVVLILLLVAQALYFFRVELAARLPGAKPALLAYCEILKCSIPLPKDPELMSIESSDLEADATHANVITLNALLHNQADYVQAYPELELTLTDIQDAPIARRTFSPKDYLKPEEVEKFGLAANREINLKVRLDTTDLKPSGYKLFLYYP